MVEENIFKDIHPDFYFSNSGSDIWKRFRFVFLLVSLVVFIFVLWLELQEIEILEKIRVQDWPRLAWPRLRCKIWPETDIEIRDKQRFFKTWWTKQQSSCDDKNKNRFVNGIFVNFCFISLIIIILIFAQIFSDRQ